MSSNLDSSTHVLGTMLGLFRLVWLLFIFNDVGRGVIGQWLFLLAFALVQAL